ncbi:MAG TPA: response regulator [Gemmatimonadaceae bacterium]|jgi:CheY-like chemotaxis protein|nr:response regulator [Gemmatimonadaceae bacterium]
MMDQRSPERGAVKARRRLPCSILVADDHDDLREAVRLVLEYFGFAVHTAATGLDALALAQATRPRILLLDMVLPAIDGEHLARMLRADPTTRDAALIATSASQSLRAAAMNAGCDTFVVKPIPPLRLVSTVRYYARHPRPRYDFDPIEPSGPFATTLRTQTPQHATHQANPRLRPATDTAADRHASIRIEGDAPEPDGVVVCADRADRR